MSDKFDINSATSIKIRLMLNHEGKIFSLFLFSSTHEIPLLEAKLETEQYLVSEWVIVESAFTFKGDSKSLILPNLLKVNPILQKFQRRIHLVINHENFFHNTRYSLRKNAMFELEVVGRKIFNYPAPELRIVKLENRFLEVEFRTRDLATDVVRSICQPSDWLLISDVDELLTASPDEIRKLKGSGAKFLALRRRRFVFDFDNLDPTIRTTPLISAQYILNDQFGISAFRLRRDGFTPDDQVYVTEYSFCFSKKGIAEKLNSYGHVAQTSEAIDRSLNLNHHLMFDHQPATLIRWYTKVRQSETYHPSHIMREWSNLQTGIINADFQLARVKSFPELFQDVRH
jgi:hypothetical protein